MNKFTLTLDDFSPHKNAGLHFESIKWCDKLIEKYPDIKINLFVPAAYCRLNEIPCWLKDYPEWCEKVKALGSNYSISLHSLYHRRSVKDFKWHKLPESNNDEFRYLNVVQANLLLDIIEREFASVGIKYSKVFRPAAWKISAPAAQVLTDRGYIIAGNVEYYKALKDKVKGLKWKSYNWDLTGPCKVKGDLLTFGHTSNWTNNFFNKERFDLVDNLLSSGNFEFKFVEEL